jgi:hypothetical protein
LGTTKGAELQKRATIELCTTSFISTIATRKWCRNGHFSKWSEKFIKAYSEKGYSYIYGTEMQHQVYMLKINDITKIS